MSSVKSAFEFLILKRKDKPSNDNRSAVKRVGFLSLVSCFFFFYVDSFRRKIMVLSSVITFSTGFRRQSRGSFSFSELFLQ